MSEVAVNASGTSPQVPPGLLHPLPVPIDPWEQVTMDFVVQLSRTKNGHDAILVIVYPIHKAYMFHFYHYQCDSTPSGNPLFIYCHFGLPPDVIIIIIISDRDSKFTRNF